VKLIINDDVDSEDDSADDDDGNDYVDDDDDSESINKEYDNKHNEHTIKSYSYYIYLLLVT